MIVFRAFVSQTLQGGGLDAQKTASGIPVTVRNISVGDCGEMDENG